MPKKRGRFIPCRGGGTATTYYTDEHDVDEDLKTIMAQGGYWPDGSWAGIMLRDLSTHPTSSLNRVASRLIYLS